MSWEIKTLGEVVTKGSSSISVNKIKDIEGDYPIYGAKGLIKNVDFYHQDREYISIIKDGAGIGRVEIREPFSSVIGTLQYIIPKENIDTRFLYYFLLGIDFSKYSQGAAIPHIYFKDYKDEKIIVPPLDEQKRIVAQLDEAFEKIEKAKEDAQKNLENAKEIFQSELNALFENPKKHWEENSFNHFYDIRDGTHDSPKYIEEGFPLVTSKNLKNGNLDMSNIKYISKEDFENINKRSKVDKFDLLFAMIGTIGNPVIIEEKPNFAIKNVALFKKNENQNTYFLKYLLESRITKNKMISEAKGTTQKFVGLNYLRNFVVKIPSLEEQQEIVEKLNALQEKTKLLEKVYEKKLSNLDELRQSILQRAFRGGEEGE